MIFYEFSFHAPWVDNSSTYGTIIVWGHNEEEARMDALQHLEVNGHYLESSDLELIKSTASSVSTIIYCKDDF